MSRIDEFITRLKALKRDIPKIVKDSLEEEREYISQLNRDQLFEGEKADGTDMPNYSPNSRSRFAPGKIKTLDEGDFYAGIKAEFDAIKLELTGTDYKTADLVTRYGFILGLTQESISLLQQRVTPIIQRKVREYIAA